MVRPVALVNGAASTLDQASLPITDAGIQRGDGAFEVVGIWDGRPFRLDDHLVRLDHSLAALGLPPAPADVIRADISVVLGGQTGDGALRVFVTSTGSRIVSVSEPPMRNPLRRLSSQPAPWIRPMGTYRLAASKTMSYAPNVSAKRAAEQTGADDALLVSLEGFVLEGTTFSVMWTRDGRILAPALDLGLVDSISRRTVLELATGMGIEHETGRYRIDDVLAADEVMTSSAVRPLVPLEAVDDHKLPASSPITTRLAAALVARRRAA